MSLGEDVTAAKKKPDKKEVVRSSSGKFVKGVSGNPAGRPKGNKNRITQLKEEMEIVLRENIRPQDLADILEEMVAKAKGGSTSAAKLILDKFMTNAKSEESNGEEKPSITIKIENLTQADLGMKGTIIEHKETENVEEQPNP